MYADHTVLFTKIKIEDDEPLIETLRLQVKEFFEVFTTFQLKVNPDKTEKLLLSTKKKRPNIKTLKLHLSFKKHVNKIMSSCYNESGSSIE